MTRLRELTESEFRTEAEGALRSVFAVDDPFGEVVSTGVEARAIWYPIGFRLEPPELDAVLLAARASGDAAFYLSVLERPPEYAQDLPYHWFVPAEEAQNYQSLGQVFVLENVLYSPRGRWGVMISHEDHAVVAGTRHFVDLLFRTLGESPELHVNRFVRNWSELRGRPGASLSWLPAFLGNLYGPENAEILLDRIGNGS